PRVGSLFFSLCRLPPCPTPFPYATLFRSGVSGLVRAGALGMRAVLRGPVRAVVRVVARPAALLRALAAGRGVPAAPVQRGLQLGLLGEQPGHLLAPGLHRRPGVPLAPARRLGRVPLPGEATHAGPAPG